MRRQTLIYGVLFLSLLALLAEGCERKKEIVIGGGPAGGTFENFASALAKLLNENMPHVRVTVKHTGGSIENLREVEEGKIPMALVFGGDAFLGSKGMLSNGFPITKDVLAVTRLYGAVAHLVVIRYSHIKELRDLKGARIAIGNPGSGSALSAMHFFASQGIWEEIIPVHEGFDMSMEDLRARNVDAVWLLVGAPNLSVAKLCREEPVRFIDLYEPAGFSAFMKAYPFYTPARITANTYYGQHRDVLTFQDSTILVANPRLDATFVHHTLELLFSQKEMAQLRAAVPDAGDLDENKGLLGVPIPLHPGAAKFWQERGLKTGPSAFSDKH
jgi:TRAP transporter TAXI family solute receptor